VLASRIWRDAARRGQKPTLQPSLKRNSLTSRDIEFLRSIHVAVDEEEFRLEMLWLRWRDANTHRDFSDCHGCGAATYHQHDLDCPFGTMMLFG
jgi:hypothetical protein